MKTKKQKSQKQPFTAEDALQMVVQTEQRWLEQEMAQIDEHLDRAIESIKEAARISSRRTTIFSGLTRKESLDELAGRLVKLKFKVEVYYTARSLEVSWGKDVEEDSFEVTRERIRQIEARALRKLALPSRTKR